ncbi:MAG: hypothetical protein QOJ59_4825, partial [Thermomicrobiales bacterium]|nr:hypothetical protein [Thermomicrobiales bacterium]
VVCLIPARNAAADLPRLLSSAATVCDAVVALDDGSTDKTPQILRASPLVARLLTNPVRTDYRGWDDAANRNRLLAAAAELAPEWILSLDADEAIDPSDAAALRDFLATDALPGCAYGFQHVPMRGDPDHYLPRYQWVYRLFAFEPGQRFPDRRLHFVPIPTSIPRSLWVQTTLRIQHYGSLTTERRIARFEKYLEADPDRAYQEDYSNLLYNPTPGELLRWEPRPPDLPVLAAAVGLDAEEAAEDGQREADGDTPPLPDSPAPALSAIVIARNDEATIARTVASVVEQDVPETFETIVVVSGGDRTAEVVREHFPMVTLIELPRPALPGEARNAGLRAARGKFVSFPGSHVELPPGSLAARLRAHRRGYAMVTGVTENGTHTTAGWASYFLDHTENLPGHGPTVIEGPPAHCSYAREPLLAVGGFPEGVRTAEDTTVNRELVRRGYVAVRDPAIRFVHRSPCRTPRRLVLHHFQRGRGWGRLLLADHRTTGGLLNREVLAVHMAGHLPARLRRIALAVRAADPPLAPHYRRARPLIVAGAVGSWLGLWYEVLRPTRGKGAILWCRPVRTIALLGTSMNGPAIYLLRLDRVANQARAVALPPALPVTAPDGRRLRLVEALGLDRPDGPPADARDVIGRAVDVEIDDALFLADGVMPSPDTAHTIDLTSCAALRGTVCRGTVDELLRTLRRFGRIRVEGPPALDSPDGTAGAAAPAAVAAFVREQLGLPPAMPVDPATEGETWLP